MSHRYQVVLAREAQRDYKAIKNPKLLARINHLLEDLATDPQRGKQLHGMFKELRAIKTFSYRLIYRLEHPLLVVMVIKIEHRRKAYRF